MFYFEFYRHVCRVVAHFRLANEVEKEEDLVGCRHGLGNLAMTDLLAEIPTE